MIKALLTITILVNLSNAITFKMWRKYICEIQKDQLPNMDISSEPEEVNIESKALFTLGITNESNIIERNFGSPDAKPEDKVSYLKVDTMNFTADSIIQMLKDRYGMDEGAPSERHNLVFTKDFKSVCTGKTVKVLINPSDYILCNLYKISKKGQEHDLRFSQTQDKDLEEELQLQGEERFFNSVYGLVGEEGNKQEMSPSEWFKNRLVGMVPFFVEDTENQICTLFALHLPNGEATNETYVAHYSQLVDFGEAVNSTDQPEVINSVKKGKEQLYDFMAQSNTMILNNPSQELTVEEKVNILQNSQNLIEQEGLNPTFVKTSIASQVQINETDMQNPIVKDYMKNIGGQKFVETCNMAAMSQSLIFDNRETIEEIQNVQLNRSFQGSQELTESQKLKNQPHNFGTLNQLDNSFNASQNSLNLDNGTQNSLKKNGLFFNP